MAAADIFITTRIPLIGQPRDAFQTGQKTKAAHQASKLAHTGAVVFSLWVAVDQGYCGVTPRQHVSRRKIF
ncbi:MAG: hypothetical protein EBW73_04845 [Betaproteobacteria bacterium]|nr:hypothetical protein [Betaproteobacteria bacterium]